MDDKLSFLLIQICRAHRNLAESRLNAVGLHAGQEGMLLYLAANDCPTQSELAEKLCIEAPTVTKTIQRLEKAGLVERHADPDDGRVSRIQLTDAGRAVIGPIHGIWDAIEASLTQGITPAEEALLRRLLLQMLENLS